MQMTDKYSDLKKAAEDVIGKLPGSPGRFLALQRMTELANPAALLGLIVEIERQSAQFKEWQARHHANYVCVADERDQLKAEAESLRADADKFKEANRSLSESNVQRRSDLNELLVEVQSMRKDAERYRWLRDSGIQLNVYRTGVMFDQAIDGCKASQVKS